MRKLHSVFQVPAILVLVLLVVNGCGKKGEQPALPDQSSFEMDFSGFPQDNSGKMRVDTTSTNFLHSAGTLLLWQIVVTVNMAIPVLAFHESFNHEAKYKRKQKKWLWEYSVTGSAGATYTCQLYGWIDGDNSKWEMYISKSGDFQNFLWYDGTVALDKSTADWRLYKDPDSPVPYVDIDYNKNADSTANITYTNVIPGDAGNGGYISYGTTSDPSFDAFYTVYYIQDDHRTEIEWNMAAKNGRVKDQYKFGDAGYHCWDANLMDAICN